MAKMKNNLSTIEKYVRIVVGILIASGGCFAKDELLKGGSLFLGCYIIITGFIGLCLIYSFLGISTAVSARKKRFY